MRRDSVTLIVAPHPDDEVLGAAIWMHRHPREQVHVVHLTDGSPRDLKDAKRLGFSTRQAYAAARRRELFEALKPVGISPSHCAECGVVDQEAFLNLPAIIHRLETLLGELRPRRILAPAYEGGHPDHDAAAFAVAVLRSRHPVFDHLEFPLYHSDDNGQMITGQFLGGAHSVRQQVLVLTPRERDLKAAMLACFRTQREILSRFALKFERFRTAPSYDFTLPPHPGPLLYERWGWSIEGEAWRRAGQARPCCLRFPSTSLLQSPRHCVILSDSMDIITGNVGWIEVICGPMFSGKSEELIRRLRRAMIARKRVEVFKPIIDNRYSDNEIVSHGDLRMHSQVVSNATEITDRLDWRSEVIGIDEANFMGPQLVDVAQRLADSGKQVIISGLDTDYLGRPFAPVPDLLAHAESITKTLAICVRCGNPAKHTQRLRGSEDLIVVGASDMYEARCRRCFEPGIPKQTELDFVKAKRQQEKS